MRRIILVLTVGVLGLVVSQSALAGVSTWDFTGNTGTGPWGPNSPDSYLTSASLAVASPNGGTISVRSTGGNPTYYLSIAGTAPGVGGSTLAFTLQAAAATSFTTLAFDYDPLGTKPPLAINWTWNISGGGSGSLGSEIITGPAGWNGASLSLSGISALSAGQTLTITGSLVGQSGLGNTGDIGFDNFAITAVPEPVHYSLGVFGLIFAGTGVGRWYQVRAKRD